MAWTNHRGCYGAARPLLLSVLLAALAGCDGGAAGPHGVDAGSSDAGPGGGDAGAGPPDAAAADAGPADAGSDADAGPGLRPLGPRPVAPTPLAAGSLFAAPTGSGTRTDNSWQRTGSVTFVSEDPLSPDFLVPVPGGGFDDLGAHANRL